MKIFQLALIFLFLVTDTVSAIQDHPLELGRTTPRYEDVVQNSQISSPVEPQVNVYSYQTSMGTVVFALPDEYQAKITQTGDSITILNTTDPVQRMVFTVVNLKNSLLDYENTMQVLWDAAISSAKFNQLLAPTPPKKLDVGGYMMAGQVSTQTEMVWQIIRSIDSDGDGKINHGITAISTMDAVSAGSVVGSVSVNQFGSTNTGYTHQEPYAGPTYAAGPNLLDINYCNKPATTAYQPMSNLVQSGRYPANKDTKVYHEPGCTWADKIKPENLLWFSSPAEAEAAGYRHCEKC